MAGRPHTYTPEKAERILGYVAYGYSLEKIGEFRGLPSAGTIFRWLNENPDFYECYTRAKEMAAERFVEESVEVARDGSNDWIEIPDGKGGKKAVQNHVGVKRDTLKVQALQWGAEKLAPSRFGARVNVEHSGTVNIAGTLSTARQRAGRILENLPGGDPGSDPGDESPEGDNSRHLTHEPGNDRDR